MLCVTRSAVSHGLTGLTVSGLETALCEITPGHGSDAIATSYVTLIWQTFCRIGPPRPGCRFCHVLFSIALIGIKIAPAFEAPSASPA